MLNFLFFYFETLNLSFVPLISGCGRNGKQLIGIVKSAYIVEEKADFVLILIEKFLLRIIVITFI